MKTFDKYSVIYTDHAKNVLTSFAELFIGTKGIGECDINRRWSFVQRSSFDAVSTFTTFSPDVYTNANQSTSNW